MRSSVRPALIFLAASCLQGCGATGGPPPPPDRGPRPEAARESAAPAAPAEFSVARVAGRPISAAALIEAFWQWDTASVRDQVERLATAEIARLEAARLGVTLAEALVEERCAADLAALARQVTDGGAAASLEDFVELRLGLDHSAFLRRFRADSAQSLLEERVVRAHLLSSERAELSVIVVEDEAGLDAARADLAAGVPFADVARARSVDPSAAAGGRIPPVVRSERSPLARAAFATPLGEVGGPVLDEESGRRLLLRVEARPEPLAGAWDVLGPRVEQSLAAEPVSDPEVWQWRAALEREYPLDLSPLLELVGEPVP